MSGQRSISALRRSFIACAFILISVSLSFPQTSRTSRQSSEDESFYKHYPWPQLIKDVKAAPAPLRSPRLFSASTHLDTTTFSRSSADLVGVIVGNAQWIDYDNDGNLDVIVSGYDGSKPVTKIYRNDNGTFTDIQAAIPGIISERGLAWGDYDNDGDYDLAITGTLDSAGTMPVAKIFRNDNGTFVDINAPLMPLLGGVAKWVDYNLDGKLDLLIAGSPDRGSTFYTKLYRNDDSTFTDSGIDFPGVWAASVDWGDFDNDGDPDLLLTGYGTWGVTSGLFRNDGSGFSFLPLPFQPVNFSSVSWGDFDNDGNLDFVVSGDPPGWDNNTFTALYHNAGDGTFEVVPSTLPQLNGSSVAWGDYDNDGDLDLAINGWENDSTNVTKIFRNDGNGVFTDIDADLPGTWWGSVAWGDVDNDGKLDLLICGGTTPQPFAAFYYGRVPWNPFAPITAIYHNNLPGTTAKPTTPPNPTAHVANGSVTFSWDQAVDVHTPQSMLTYNLRVGTTPGGSDVVSPASNLTTGVRRQPTVGNNYHKIVRELRVPPARYYWSVQSVNNAYTGSAFSGEQSIDGNLTAYWQMVSLPGSYADSHAATIFPTAVTKAFAYASGSGYVSTSVLESGKGYWLKFPTSTFPQILAGGDVSSVSVSVVEGWNLVGSISTNVDPASITSDPAGMELSEFVGYDRGYAPSTTIQPGHAYWVKANESGRLTISSGSTATAARIRIVPTTDRPPAPPAEPTRGGVPGGGLPSAFDLRQNYPNPFNPATLIEFFLTQDALVTLEVWNLLGQKVATLAHQTGMKAGANHVQFDGRQLASGVYFYRLIAADRATQRLLFSATKKMVLIR